MYFALHSVALQVNDLLLASLRYCVFSTRVFTSDSLNTYLSTSLSQTSRNHFCLIDFDTDLSGIRSNGESKWSHYHTILSTQGLKNHEIFYEISPLTTSTIKYEWQ